MIDDEDRNEAYEVEPMKPRPHGLPADWWTVTRNGVPVFHFPPGRHHLARRYATDPAYRASLKTKKLHG